MAVPGFSLQQLSYLVAVADYGSMTAAAETEHVTQAAISTGIRDLERRLGVQLLVRRPGYGVSLTEAGSAAVGDARRVLAAAQDVQSGAHDPTADLRGQLTVGCYTTLAPLYLPQLHSQLAARHPALELSVVEGSQDELRRGLNKGTCEVIVTYEAGLRPGLITRPIRDHRPYALLAADHPLARQPSVTVEEIATEPLILYSHEPCLGNTEELFRRVGATPRIAHTSPNIEVVRSLVARKVGWTHLLQRWPLDVSMEGLPLTCLPFSGDVPTYRVVAAWSQQDTLSRRAAAAVAMLGEIARNLGHWGEPAASQGPSHLMVGAHPPTRSSS